MLDLYLLRIMRGAAVSAADIHVIRLGSHLAGLGLALLWISGVGFLVSRWLVSPELLADPKVQAKLLIVTILTINGALLHTRLLPLVARNIGQPLFGPRGVRQQREVRVLAAVSAASWWTPFVLGAVRELNFAAPIQVYLAGYLVAVLTAFLVLTAASRSAREALLPGDSNRRARPAEPVEKGLALPGPALRRAS